MNVLIVEDNPVSAKVLEHTLDKHGYETLTARDGDQALECLEKHPEIELLITDLVMPNMDGVELVKKIRDRPEWCELPILVCTSKKPEAVNQWLPGQGWKYLFKPIRAESLMHRVKEAFAQQRPIVQTPDQTMSEIGMDSQAFCEILDEFAKIVKTKIDVLEKQIHEKAWEPLVMDDLIEGAKLVRAERVMAVLSRLDQGGAARKSDLLSSLYPLLLRELKAMHHYLTLYAS